MKQKKYKPQPFFAFIPANMHRGKKMNEIVTFYPRLWVYVRAHKI